VFAGVISFDAHGSPVFLEVQKLVQGQVAGTWHSEGLNPELAPLEMCAISPIFLCLCVLGT
jgi:hypothetical protein